MHRVLVECVTPGRDASVPTSTFTTPYCSLAFIYIAQVLWYNRK